MNKWGWGASAIWLIHRSSPSFLSSSCSSESSEWTGILLRVPRRQRWPYQSSGTKAPWQVPPSILPAISMPFIYIVLSISRLSHSKGLYIVLLRWNPTPSSSLLLLLPSLNVFVYPSSYAILSALNHRRLLYHRFTRDNQAWVPVIAHRAN